MSHIRITYHPNTELPATQMAGIIPELKNRITQNRKVTETTETDRVDNAINAFGNNFFGIVYTLLGAIAILLLIWAGVQYITAAGNPDATKRARQSIINIVMGIALLVSSYTIIALILNLAQKMVSGQW